MSIASQISALQTDKINIANAINDKGGSVTELDGFDDFAAAISGISSSGIEDVSTSAELDAKKTEANIGKVYKYTGTTTSTYINGNLYIPKQDGYTYYRLYITKFIRSGTQRTFASIAEFSLYDSTSTNLARQTGCVYTSSSDSASETDKHKEKAFDGNSGTVWHSDADNYPNTTNWLCVQLPTKAIITSFGIVPRSDSWFGDFPVTFKLQGSNDATTWTDLYSASELTTGWTQSTERIFTLEQGG